jgi:TolB-like protein/TM2 domain-containing membrane protein YozV
VFISDTPLYNVLPSIGKIKVYVNLSIKIGLFILVLPFSPIAAQQTSIAVLELEATGIEKYVAQALTNRLRAELFAVDKFTVLERERMEEILSEQGFQQTGCVSDVCVAEAGKLIGVRQMVAGRVAKLGSTYSIHTRLIDVGTGRIMKSFDDECNCDIETVLKVSMKRAAYALSDYRIEQDRKSPALALILSLGFPGLGQIYNEQYLWKGAIQQGVFITGIYILDIGGELATDNEYLAIAGLSCVLGAYIWSFIDAYSGAKRINREIDQLSGLAFKQIKIQPQIRSSSIGLNLSIHF